jgi:hydrogenase maturation protease
MGPHEPAAPVLLFAYGNPSRGDDALGPELIGQLRRVGAGEASAPVEYLTDFQLQIEHVPDLTGRELVLFADASVSAPAPFAFYRVHAATQVGYTTHSTSPEQLLEVYRQTSGREPPPCFMLALRGYAFGLGDPPSPGARSSLAAALELTRELLASPTSHYWMGRVQVDHRHVPGGAPSAGSHTRGRPRSG